MLHHYIMRPKAIQAIQPGEWVSRRAAGPLGLLSRCMEAPYPHDSPKSHLATYFHGNHRVHLTSVTISARVIRRLPLTQGSDSTRTPWH